MRQKTILFSVARNQKQTTSFNKWYTKGFLMYLFNKIRLINITKDFGDNITTQL
jgi:hypothetical protein